MGLPPATNGYRTGGKKMTSYYQLTLNFKAPFLAKGSGTLKLGIDSAMQRYQGKPVLNGSAVRGTLKETLEIFAHVLNKSGKSAKAKTTQEFCKQWFGQASNGFEPLRSQLHFDYFWTLEGELPEAQTRTRIKIDDTGKVENGALQVIEDCFPLGTDISFTGHIIAHLDDSQDDKAYFERLMTMALDYMPAIGSFKGIGFGRLNHDKTKLTEINAQTYQEQVLGQLEDKLSGDETHFNLQFSLDRPFCVGRPRTPSSNRIISSDAIQGNVLKAVIAAQYERAGNLKQLQEELCFDQLVFSHASPSPVSEQGKRFPVVPLSMAWVGDKDNAQLWDMSQEQCQQDLNDQALIFQPDWKPKDFERAYPYNATKPKRLNGVRTAIDTKTQTAKNQQLFSVESVDPTGFIWSSNISLINVPENQRAAVLKRLRACFEQPISGIGKTKATLTNIRLLPEPKYTQPTTLSLETLSQGQKITIALMTDARLFPLGIEQRGEHSAQALYSDYWEKYSEKSLKMINFFAQQQRQGGEYHYHHFQKTRSEYTPEWLTVAGSMFVLEVNDPTTAKALLAKWQEVGIPAASLTNGAPPTWETTPYLPEHGFGEIVINWEQPNKEVV